MTCEVQQPIKIVQGEDKLIDIKIRDEKNDPFDLTGYTTIAAKFKKADNSLLSLAIGSGVTVLSAPLGRIQVLISDTQSATLKLGEFLDFEVQITIGTTTRIVQFLRMVHVRKPLS